MTDHWISSFSSFTLDTMKGLIDISTLIDIYCSTQLDPIGKCLIRGWWFESLISYWADLKIFASISIGQTWSSSKQNLYKRMNSLLICMRAGGNLANSNHVFKWDSSCLDCRDLKGQYIQNSLIFDYSISL